MYSYLFDVALVCGTHCMWYVVVSNTPDSRVFPQKLKVVCPWRLDGLRGRLGPQKNPYLVGFELGPLRWKQMPYAILQRDRTLKKRGRSFDRFSIYLASALISLAPKKLCVFVQKGKRSYLCLPAKNLICWKTAFADTNLFLKRGFITFRSIVLGDIRDAE